MTAAFVNNCEVLRFLVMDTGAFAGAGRAKIRRAAAGLLSWLCVRIVWVAGCVHGIEREWVMCLRKRGGRSGLRGCVRVASLEIMRIEMSVLSLKRIAYNVRV